MKRLSQQAYLLTLNARYQRYAFYYRMETMIALGEECTKIVITPPDMADIFLKLCLQITSKAQLDTDREAAKRYKLHYKKFERWAEKHGIGC